jgi:hypothetical protein
MEGGDCGVIEDKPFILAYTCGDTGEYHENHHSG